MRELSDNASETGPSETRPTLLDPRYLSAARDALLIQAPLMLFGAVILDGGYILRIFSIASIAFWIGAAIMIIRRPNPAQSSDLFFVRFGYLALLPVAMAAAVLLHRWH